MIGFFQRSMGSDGGFLAKMQCIAILPNMGFRRTHEEILRCPTEAFRLFPVWLFLGPRQVGKSSLPRSCAEPTRQIVNLDELVTRGRAHRDPALFAADLRLPLLIDEIQYAPAVLSAIKRLADLPTTPSGAIWLRGFCRQ
jgi:predicted AAA+ superfamily ATPase